MARRPGLSKRQVWLAEYLKCWNASEAARRAGYSFPNRAGNKLLQAMATEIKATLDEKTMSATETMVRLGEQARAEYAAYLYTSESGQTYLDMERLLADGKGHLVKGVKPTAYGQQIEFYDAQTALVHIGRHHKLFVDRQEKDSRIAVVELTLDQWQAQADERLRQAEEVVELFQESGAEPDALE